MMVNQKTLKEKCKFSYCIVQDFNARFQPSLEDYRSRSKLESELENSKLRGKTNINKIQTSSNSKQTCCFTYTQVHIIDNIETESKTMSRDQEENSINEDFNNCLESKRIMVPSGNYLLN